MVSVLLRHEMVVDVAIEELIIVRTAIYKRDIERFVSTISASSQSATRAASRLVLLRAELLSSEYLSVLAMRTANLSIKLTLVTTCLPMSECRNRVVCICHVSTANLSPDW
jgi:hypothetical protein